MLNSFLTLGTPFFTPKYQEKTSTKKNKQKRVSAYANKCIFKPYSTEDSLIHGYKGQSVVIAT